MAEVGQNVKQRQPNTPDGGDNKLQKETNSGADNISWDEWVNSQRTWFRMPSYLTEEAGSYR